MAGLAGGAVVFFGSVAARRLGPSQIPINHIGIGTDRFPPKCIENTF